MKKNNNYCKLIFIACALLITPLYISAVPETPCELDTIHAKSKDTMLKEVSLAWERPLIFGEMPEKFLNPFQYGIFSKLKKIRVPNVHFNNSPLNSVVFMLAELSMQYDSPHLSEEERGINFVLIDPDKINPKVTLTLKNLSLEQVLELIVKSVNFHYEIENEAVTIRPGRPNHSNLITECFPITRGAIIRMTGNREQNFTPNINESLPFQSTQEYESHALKTFLQNAGIPFDAYHQGPEGAEFAFDGSQIIVTQTPRNLQKIHNLLERYKDTLQVEIESKFMEVQEGALEEIGFRWLIANNDCPDKQFFRTAEGERHNNLRTLANAFSSKHRASGDGQILTQGNRPSEVLISNKPPLFPNSINVGVNTVPVASIFSVLDNWKVKVLIDALEQHTGTDLMSAPKVTVLSGKTAKITVAQVLRYPEVYGDIQSAVGIASGDIGASGAGVTITAGTPKNFVDKNVGVEMEVTPFVEDDRQSISLKLEPRVTEFEGFVEYGGRSIAISHNTTVDVPSGFFQPIFSTREIKTEVTIANGATVIMGGLTREEVKQVHDKVPVLGDIPFIGRIFRSKGVSNQKRNLLIFVTANLIGVGGAPIKESLYDISKNDIFQNPIEIVPSGIANRR
ncbi:hypothetical protein AYO37_00515 [Opitutia bacterium SCGC AG-212-L18]|nr:hypothetical protein AYO37_00515 [Opitutae bacterium SCGC AG-212-L18]